MKYLFLIFLFALLLVNVNTLMNQSPAYADGYIYLANGIKVDNVVNANCHVINASPYTEFCVVWFAGDNIPVYIVSDSFGYLAFDVYTFGRVEF